MSDEKDDDSVQPSAKVTLPPQAAKILVQSITHGVCLEPQPIFCTHQNRVYQLWRDRLNGVGEFRPLQQYDPSWGYQIVS